MGTASKQKILFFHLLFCCLFLVVPVLISSRPPGEPFLTITRPFIRDIIGNVLLLGFGYVNYYILIPSFYFKKQYVFYTACIIICLLLVSLLPSVITGRNFPGFDGPPPPGFNRYAENMQLQTKWYNFLFNEIKHQLYLFVIALVFTLLLRIRMRLAEMKEEKLNAELSSLKAQINPHFLFNTLNSIYALTVKKDDRAGDAIIQLSGLMRYIIKDAHDYKIPLQKELEYIENYIALQKSRLGDTVKIHFSYEGDMEDKEIAPLILITYIENAFKYGVNPDENGEINISIAVDNTGVCLQVKNNKVRKSDKTISTGIGIENTSERLNLLYPAKHQLNIAEDEQHYSVTLTINLQ